MFGDLLFFFLSAVFVVSTHSYTKWTQLDSFQRTRGMLRFFALALREAETWDTNPLISANVFLGEPNQTGLSKAATELTEMAEREEIQSQQSWVGILTGELAKARTLQQEEFPVLAEHREIEQAVFATFLHSQPMRAQSEAKTRELLLLVGQARPPQIDLENALLQWAERSWFLDEKNLESSRGNSGKIPGAWRLGMRPNLKQVHYTACERLIERDIEAKLIKEIENCTALFSDLPIGVKSHSLPAIPKDIDDDGNFHYAVMGPDAVSRPGSPSKKAQRFLALKGGDNSPRVNRNAVILATPSFDGLVDAQKATRQYLGWLQVEDILKGSEIDQLRQARLKKETRDAEMKMKDAVRQAYNVFVTATDQGDIQAFQVISTNGDSLFSAIKKNQNARIQEATVTAEALLPDGPYDLWKKGETARPFRHLVEAFAQVPELPKMLNHKDIERTLLQGGRNGLFVFRLQRLDKSFQTFWRELPNDVALKDPALEVVLSAVATLSSLSTRLLEPGALTDLWQGEMLSLSELYTYFAQRRTISEQPEGYDYPRNVITPLAEQEVLKRAVREAVKEKRLCLIAGQRSFLGEDIQESLLSDEATLASPPPALHFNEILPDKLPEAWPGSETTALAITEALAAQKGKPLPWSIVRAAIDGAKIAHVLDTSDDSRWPCEYAEAGHAILLLPVAPTPSTPQPATNTYTPPMPSPTTVHEQQPRSWLAGAYLEIAEIMDLHERLGDLVRLTVGQDLEVYVRIELSGKEGQPVPTETIEKVNALLKEVSEQLKLQ